MPRLVAQISGCKRNSHSAISMSTIANGDNFIGFSAGTGIVSADKFAQSPAKVPKFCSNGQPCADSNTTVISMGASLACGLRSRVAATLPP